MRVVLHRIAHNIGHLVVAAIVHALHRVQNAALHRLKTIHNMRHGTLQYHIRGILQIIIPEQALYFARILLHVYRCALCTHMLRTRCSRFFRPFQVPFSGKNAALLYFCTLYFYMFVTYSLTACRILFANTLRMLFAYLYLRSIRCNRLVKRPHHQHKLPCPGPQEYRYSPQH